jgi:hypothetical protein
MSLEKQIEENTIALRELTAAILGAFSAQVALTPEPPFPGEHLYESVLTEFTALQSLDHRAAAFLLNDNGVRAVNQLPASQYAAFLDDIATVRADIVKKLAVSQESTIAPIAETSSQEPASAQDATTGGDDGKKLESADTTGGAQIQATTATPANATTTNSDSATATTGDKPVFTEYQQVADEFLKLVKDKGRDAAIELLTAHGVKTAKELKPEQYQAFGEDVLRILGDSLV